MNPHLQRLGNFTRPRRAQKGIAMGAMAKAMGITSASLSEYEIHKSPFPSNWVGKIAAALDLTPEETQELKNLRVQDLLNQSESQVSDETDEFISAYLQNRHRLSNQDIQKLYGMLIEMASQNDLSGSKSSVG